jgi:two-component system nitrogen regulation sensor histidine kinase NtrY
MIIKQTDALRHLVNEFYKFARLPEAKKIPAQINPIIEESLTIFRNGHPQVQFQFQGDPEIPIFKFDPDQIKRVLINLVNNSLHALAKDRLGKITLETHFNKKLKLLTISVNDNGLGIPAEDRNRIFEPYYSTKETGTGLGLPIVKRIIEDHNGFIRALANEDYGTRMIIELPIV